MKTLSGTLKGPTSELLRIVKDLELSNNIKNNYLGHKLYTKSYN